LAASAAGLLFASACGTADPNIFGGHFTPTSGGSPSAGAASLTGSAGSEAGGGNSSGNSGSGGNPTETVAGSGNADNGGSGGSGAGCAFSCGEGGRAIGGSENSGGAAGSGDQAGSGSELMDCTAFSPDASYMPATQHCYLVDNEPRTFAEAQLHCKELKAHLVTLSNQAENDFAWSMHSDEHWIGSQDGKAPKQSGIGTYTWVTDEPFEYTNWSSNQPNASKTECVDGGACYEHCAFQWKGGEHDSQWNDRYCMHTIASICEWDEAP